VTSIVLWLWKVLPLPDGLRWAILWLGNTKFLAGVLAAIFDEEGRILLQRHTYRTRHPWGMPGGWIHEGELPPEALAREVGEETGLSMAVGPLVAARGGHERPRLVLTYLCNASGTARVSVETAEVGYFALDALPDGVSPDQLAPMQIAARVRQHLLGRPASEGEAALWDTGEAQIRDAIEQFE